MSSAHHPQHPQQDLFYPSIHFTASLRRSGIPPSSPACSTPQDLAFSRNSTMPTPLPQSTVCLQTSSAVEPAASSCQHNTDLPPPPSRLMSLPKRTKSPRRPGLNAKNLSLNVPALANMSGLALSTPSNSSTFPSLQTAPLEATSSYSDLVPPPPTSIPQPPPSSSFKRSRLARQNNHSSLDLDFKRSHKSPTSKSLDSQLPCISATANRQPSFSGPLAIKVPSSPHKATLPSILSAHETPAPSTFEFPTTTTTITATAATAATATTASSPVSECSQASQESHGLLSLHSTSSHTLPRQATHSTSSSTSSDRVIIFNSNSLLPEDERMETTIDAYPNGPLAIEDNIYLYSEPVRSEAEKFDVIINVAQEVKNPFDTAAPSDNSWYTHPTVPASSSATTCSDSVNSAFSDNISSSPPSSVESATCGDEDSILPLSSGMHATPDEEQWKHASTVPEYIYVPWAHTSQLTSDLDWLTSLMMARVAEGKSILVHCQCGVSRSASLIVAYKMRQERWDLHTSYNWVKARSPVISPNMTLIYQLMEWGKMLGLPAPRSNSQFAEYDDRDSEFP